MARCEPALNLLSILVLLPVSLCSCPSVSFAPTCGRLLARKRGLSSIKDVFIQARAFTLPRLSTKHTSSQGY